MYRRLLVGALTLSLGSLFPTSALAAPFSFSTGAPDGRIATLSRTASTGKLETETADDFVTTGTTLITSATFTGLLVGAATTANIQNVEIELYHVFPFESTNPPDGRVLTRMNSPSDNNFAAADGALGQLTFTTTVLNPSFMAANSVVKWDSCTSQPVHRRRGPRDGHGSTDQCHFHYPIPSRGGSRLLPA
jgi:hypothetical protein